MIAVIYARKIKKRKKQKLIHTEEEGAKKEERKKKETKKNRTGNYLIKYLNATGCKSSQHENCDVVVKFRYLQKPSTETGPGRDDRKREKKGKRGGKAAGKVG